MTELTFFIINTNTAEGIYRPDDFINGSTGQFWKKSDPGAPLTVILTAQFNFDASDNNSSVTVQYDQFSEQSRNANSITHVVAKTSNRTIAYSVVKIEYLNDKQLKYHLVEDDFLSRINNTLNSKMLITRSNDESRFFVNDTADLTFANTRTEINTGVRDLTGKWVLFTYLLNTEDLPKDGDFLRGIKVYYKPLRKENYERFKTFSSMILKYPTGVSVDNPSSINYYNKIVYINDTGMFYQAVYDARLNHILWITIPATFIKAPNDPLEAILPYMIYATPTALIPTNVEEAYGIGPSVNLLPGDIMTFNIAFPLSDFIFSKVKKVVAGGFVYEYQKILAYDRVEKIEAAGSGFDLTPYLKSKRIISGLLLNESGTERPVDDPDITDYNIYLQGNSSKIVPKVQNYIVSEPDNINAIVLPKNLQSIYKINLTVTVKSKNSEPFTNYFLSVFGKEIQIKARLLNTPLYIVNSIGSLNWDIIIYSGNLSNILHADSMQYSVPYSVDKYEEFLAQNSTYIQSKFVNTVLGAGGKLFQTAAAAGMVKTFGNPDTVNPAQIAASAGISAAGTILGVAQNLINAGFQEKAMKDAPDTMKSGSSDYGTALIKPFSIFMYKNEAFPLAKNIMQTNLELRGFPTYFVATPTSLAFQDNETYGRCKIIAGKLLEISFNYHITSKINTRLLNGVVILE